MDITIPWQLLQVHSLATQAVPSPNDFTGSLWATCSETCDPGNQANAGLLTGGDLRAV